jgi:hypothetical protein
VTVTAQSAKYATLPRRAWFSDDMKKRADNAPSAGGDWDMNWDESYYADVWAYHTKLGRKARANAKSVDLDRHATKLCTNKALIRRELFFYENFFKTGVWSTEIQGKTSGGGGDASLDLKWTDANALPIKQIKNALDNAEEITGFRMNKGTFSRKLWTQFCEHPNVLARINNGQTPNGPAEITTQMVATWLELDAVYVAAGNVARNKKGAADEDALTFMDQTQDKLLLTYTPAAPALLEPSAFYFFDWQADDLVNGFGTAVSRWYDLDTKSMKYEIEMATDAKRIASDCGVLFHTMR